MVEAPFEEDPIAMSDALTRAPLSLPPSRMRFLLLAAGAAAIGLVVLVNALRLFSNPTTPPGYIGYLTRGALFGHVSFVGLQTGPTSSGLGWLLEVTNVSVTPYTYSEDFSGDSAVLSADSLKIAFRVHLVWRVRPEGVKEFIERYSTLRPNDAPNRIVEVGYANFIREPLRTYARDEVQKHKGLDIKDNITPIGDAITRRIIALTANTPFEVRSVVVGNIQYPIEVADAVSKKLAAVQELERKLTEIEITKREKDKRIIEAEGITAATEIISQRLTAGYLQYEAIKAQHEMTRSPNHTTIYIPVGPMGVPLVGNLNVGHGDPPSGAAVK